MIIFDVLLYTRNIIKYIPSRVIIKYLLNCAKV